MSDDDVRNSIATVAEEGTPSLGVTPSSATGREKSPLVLLKAAVVIALVLFIAGALEYSQSNFIVGLLMRRANENFDKGGYESAAEQYREALELEPDLEGVHYRVAYANEMLGRYIEAVDSYALHLQNNPWDTEALMRLGSIYLKFDMYDDAMLLFEEAAERLPDALDVGYALSVVYERVGRSEKAAEGYVRLTGSDAVRDPEVLINSARALMKLGRYDDALDGFTRANELLPRDDRRAFHGMNAAKTMLGWPTDDSMVMTPGQSIGNIRIGERSADVLNTLGEPADFVIEGDHELWLYRASEEDVSTYVFFQDGHVIEMATKSKLYRTADGLGLKNFLEPRHAGRFDRWIDDEEPAACRYILKGGGLALYSADEPIAVIYSGDVPLSTENGRKWRVME
ncbi:MAG: tetratricopeptide repeat protein [Synergistaceae bacterium]|jgi:tetratricopeptide (TPR) repeat protein|nr:tetratricopeptide repeat protein [Synergistaceae bacterium]